MTDPKQSAKVRATRKSVSGRVTSDKMAKTIVVEVERLVRHPRYEKFVRRRTKVRPRREQRCPRR